MKLSKEKWEKLVCAMFTGVELSDGKRGLIVSGEIRKVLGKHLSPYALSRCIKKTSMVVLFQSSDRDGELGSEHQLSTMQTASMIGMSYSPCKILNLNQKEIC